VGPPFRPGPGPLPPDWRGPPRRCGDAAMRRSFSTATTSAVPRCRASQAMAPLPQHRSSQRQPRISAASRLITPSRTRAAVGRAVAPGRLCNLRPPLTRRLTAVPPTPASGAAWRCPPRPILRVELAGGDGALPHRCRDGGARPVDQRGAGGGVGGLSRRGRARTRPASSPSPSAWPSSLVRSQPFSRCNALARGWSRRRLQRNWGVSRNTISRYLTQRGRRPPP
jgi:hypothetical protein